MSAAASSPPRYPPKVRAVPAIRQLYWCDFPQDAHLPEMWKVRPVVVVSFRNTLSGTVNAVPCTTVDQGGARFAFKLTTTIDGRPDSWALCDKLTTVAVSRLIPDKGGVRRLPADEFHQLLAVLLDWLPRLP
jgi:mRNA interferase MazF